MDLEEKKKFSFLCLFTSAFRFLMTLSRNQKLRKQENQMKWTLRKNCALSKDDIVEYYVFSVSLTGIVKSPLFKRWIRVCINRLLVWFLSHNFVIWCVLLFQIFPFCIKVAGAQTCSSPRPLVTTQKFAHKIFVIILRDIIGLKNFLLSFSQS